MKIQYCLIIIVALPFLSCHRNAAPTHHTPKPPASPQGKSHTAKNIIFLIGDGMGLTQVTALMYHSNRKLNLERFPVIGLHKSHSADDLITDSAAGATAFSCGCKTYNAAIGMYPDTTPCKTIMESAKSKGLGCGTIVTCNIQHATPAAFYAHAAERDSYQLISTYLPSGTCDLFIGGGQKFLTNRTTDSRDLFKELKQSGYTVYDTTQQGIKLFNTPSVKKAMVFTARIHPKRKSEGRNYLPEAVQNGIQFLKTRFPSGYFLMVESSQIDWGGHANETPYVLSEMEEFDQVVGQVLDWAEKDENTLVVVTGDHETGGLAINPGSKRGNLQTSFATKSHSATMIPVYAYGPGAELFAGIYENTAIYEKMMKVLRLK